MQPTAPPTEVASENATEVLHTPPHYHEPPPSYSEINMKPFSYNTPHYGACPTPAPPPYTPSPSRSQTVSEHNKKLNQKGVYVPQSGIMMPLNAASSNFRPVEPSVRKKYAAFGCCAFFLVIIMIAAYLGRNSKRYHYHYRQNYNWNF